MQSFFKCCNAVYETHSPYWICAAHPSYGGCIDEETIGDEAVYRSSYYGAGHDERHMSRRGAAPSPVGPGGHEDEKETAKQRLQRLIRDFAHDAVGPGLVVEAQCKSLCNDRLATPAGTLDALLRMDRRLSRIELWAANFEVVTPGTLPSLEIALQKVTSIVKGSSGGAQEADNFSLPADLGNARESCTLTIVRRDDPLLRLCFDSPISRDRAYTGLRIFQMSVDQAPERAQKQSSGNGQEGT